MVYIHFEEKSIFIYYYYFSISALWKSWNWNVIQQIKKHRVTIPCKWSFEKRRFSWKAQCFSWKALQFSPEKWKAQWKAPKPDPKGRCVLNQLFLMISGAFHMKSIVLFMKSAMLFIWKVPHFIWKVPLFMKSATFHFELLGYYQV